MKARIAHLTPRDFDLLRRIRAATDAKRDLPPVPVQIARKLRAFGLITPNDDRPAITDLGRDALLEQNMRDAEER